MHSQPPAPELYPKLFSILSTRIGVPAGYVRITGKPVPAPLLQFNGAVTVYSPSPLLLACGAGAGVGAEVDGADAPSYVGRKILRIFFADLVRIATLLLLVLPSIVVKVPLPLLATRNPI
jgi:hypothetical protein